MWVELVVFFVVVEVLWEVEVGFLVVVVVLCVDEREEVFKLVEVRGAVVVLGESKLCINPSFPNENSIVVVVVVIMGDF